MLTSISVQLAVLVAVLYVLDTDALPQPKTLAVDCQSLGNREEFKHRLKFRDNAEDQTTIWLFQNEELSIKFELQNSAMVGIMDVRYSNDGDWDLVSLYVDDKRVGSFMTVPHGDWGKQWNEFQSSGPIGGKQFLQAGNHTVSLRIVQADTYGVEIDYIRLFVNGSIIKGLNKDDVMCVHRPGVPF